MKEGELSKLKSDFILLYRITVIIILLFKIYLRDYRAFFISSNSDEYFKWPIVILTAFISLNLIRIFQESQDRLTLNKWISYALISLSVTLGFLFFDTIYQDFILVLTILISLYPKRSGLGKLTRSSCACRQGVKHRRSLSFGEAL